MYYNTPKMEILKTENHAELIGGFCLIGEES
jgi:hypothetical protein